MESLRVKYPKAVQGALEHLQAFKELCTSADAKANGRQWSLKAKRARNRRNNDMKYIGDMKIYEVDRKQCMCHRLWQVQF